MKYDRREVIRVFRVASRSMLCIILSCYLLRVGFHSTISQGKESSFNKW